MLDNTVAMWRKADPSTPVIPAIHLVAVVAQGYAGPDRKWRLREGPDTIEQAYRWAQSRQGLLFVDIQAGHSTLQQELPPLLKYLERADVHLGIDPEFYMHYKREGIRPSARSSIASEAWSPGARATRASRPRASSSRWRSSRRTCGRSRYLRSSGSSSRSVLCDAWMSRKSTPLRLFAQP